MDIISIIGITNLVIFMFYIEHLSIKQGKKITIRDILKFNIIFAIPVAAILFSFAFISKVEGAYLYAAQDIFYIVLALLIVDVIFFYIIRSLYRQFPFIGKIFGHKEMRKRYKEKREKK
jgi:hypothetical protein